MQGAGKFRSDWNVALLEDVVARSYADLLIATAAEIDPGSAGVNAYYALFEAPTKTLQEEFQALLGDSFEEDNPALQDAFEQMEAAGANTAAQEICVKRKAKQRAMKMRKRIQKGLNEASEQSQQPPPDYVDPAATESASMPTSPRNPWVRGA